MRVEGYRRNGKSNRRWESCRATGDRVGNAGLHKVWCRGGIAVKERNGYARRSRGLSGCRAAQCRRLPFDSSQSALSISEGALEQLRQLLHALFLTLAREFGSLGTFLRLTVRTSQEILHLSTPRNACPILRYCLSPGLSASATIRAPNR